MSVWDIQYWRAYSKKGVQYYGSWWDRQQFVLYEQLITIRRQYNGIIVKNNWGIEPKYSLTELRQFFIEPKKFFFFLCVSLAQLPSPTSNIRREKEGSQSKIVKASIFKCISDITPLLMFEADYLL